MTPEDCRLLFEYNAWANRRILDSCDALSEDQFTENLRSSFPSVRETLAHIAAAQWIWTERWHGSSPTAPPDWYKAADRAALRAKLTELDRNLIEYTSHLSPADLERVTEYRNMSGQGSAQPLWQPLQHLANHGTYHRGQIVTMLRQLGAAAPHTDLIVFYREREKGAA
ncbi:MAG: DinB family protein [Acidobacteriota bacterium]|nr:DinB family protein [Acidobacteriota bacterium]